jgi:hypothetical protein
MFQCKKKHSKRRGIIVKITQHDIINNNNNDDGRQECKSIDFGPKQLQNSRKSYTIIQQQHTDTAHTLRIDGKLGKEEYHGQFVYFALLLY